MDSVREGVHWVEYGITSACILTSLVISLWIGKKGSKTVSNYVLGNKQMPLWAISLSHIASSVSSITMVAIPTESYYFGTMTAIYNSLTYVTMGLIQSYIFLPVFYKHQFGSLFEYCELRFSKKVRNLASAINVLYELSQISIMIYAVSLVISQVGGISTIVSTTGLMAICIIYTSLGGFKGVIYADTFQVFIIVGCFVMLLLMSFIKSGGLSSIVDGVINGDLIEYNTMKWDARHNVWTAYVGNGLTTAMYFTGSAAYQRAISLPSLPEAQISNLIGTFGFAVIALTTSIVGLSAHSIFQNCDPFNAKLIGKLDHIIPYFVMLYGAALPGVVGLFLSGIICAALSTTATYLNNSTAVVYKDFVQRWFKGQSDGAARHSMQILCVVLGIICWSVALMLKKAKSIHYLHSGLIGLTGSTIFAILVIGIFLPRINSKAVLVGIIGWIGVVIVLGATIVTNPKPSYPTKHKRVDGCDFNVTSVQNSSIPIDPQVWNDMNPIHRISSTMYSTIAFSFIIFVSILASFCTKKKHDVDPDLTSHLFQRSRRTETVENKVEIPLLLIPQKIEDQHEDRRQEFPDKGAS